MPAQLEISPYILENRIPTLTEICQEIADVPVETKKVKSRNPFRNKLKYPKNWTEISRQFKKRVNYKCQVCSKKCLKPEDSKEGLTLSQISKQTLNCHHIDGNTFNNSPENIFVVCSKHHLQIHRGRRLPPEGQQRLFDLTTIKNT